MNTFGTLLTLTTAGESHGAAMTGILDGVPAGFRIDPERVALEMQRRRPGHATGSTRREADNVTFLSGLKDGVTLGTPVAFIIENTDARSSDYDAIQKLWRPGHADYTYQAKYGLRDARGGGRASARETSVRVAAGAVALQILEALGITVSAHTEALGGIEYRCADIPDQSQIYSNPVRCPDSETAARMEQILLQAKQNGNTVGGIVRCTVTGIGTGLGEPIYGKLQSKLAAAMMSINAARGFDFGDGFEAASMTGADSIDAFALNPDGTVGFESNHNGGLLGGISTGAPVTMRVAFKPIATMMRPLPSMSPSGHACTLPPRGRHDVSAVPRAVPVVRAMAALCILDAVMIARGRKLL